MERIPPLLLFVEECPHAGQLRREGGSVRLRIRHAGCQDPASGSGAESPLRTFVFTPAVSRACFSPPQAAPPSAATVTSAPPAFLQAATATERSTGRPSTVMPAAATVTRQGGR